MAVAQGILVLHMEALRGCLNMKIFVDTDDDLRLARRCAGAAVSVASAEVACDLMLHTVTAAQEAWTKCILLRMVSSSVHEHM